MNHDTWQSAHPYLHPLAAVDALVEEEAVRTSVPVVPIPDWNNYAEDFRAGVPLLRSARASVDLSAPQDAVVGLIEALASSTPGAIARQCQALAVELLAGESVSPAYAGLFRYVLWTVLGRSLEPVVQAFDGWRDEERWLRNYCPTCGEPPAMAQLTGKDPGRLRKLVCGCCRTRWRYRRNGCPFCDSDEAHRFIVVAVEGERGLRIDYCQTCNGYLKKYDGEGNENVLLADWTSLHLDYIARDRGLRRMAASLYDLEAV